MIMEEKFEKRQKRKEKQCHACDKHPNYWDKQV